MFFLFTPPPIKKYLKFGDGDGQKLCRVKKVDVSSTFIGLTLVSSNDTITIKKILFKHKQ